VAGSRKTPKSGSLPVPPRDAGDEEVAASSGGVGAMVQNFVGSTAHIDERTAL
jgi:hypothetical protein